MTPRTRIAAALVTATVTMAGLGAAAYASNGTSSDKKLSASDRKELERLRADALRLTAANAEIQRNLKTFDTLDFDVFSNQQWDRLSESHADDIKVVWPDGHYTIGLEKHTEDLKALFVHAPDSRIEEHPIAFGSGNMTVAEGIFEGTFTQPLPDGKGGFIAPTGKAFKLPMATIGIWEDGVMIEEHLFWDNQAYAKQLGLA